MRRPAGCVHGSVLVLLLSFPSGLLVALSQESGSMGVTHGHCCLDQDAAGHSACAWACSRGCTFIWEKLTAGFSSVSLIIRACVYGTVGLHNVILSMPVVGTEICDIWVLQTACSIFKYKFMQQNVYLSAGE